MSEGRGRPLALVFPLFVVLATEDLPFKKLDGLGLGTYYYHRTGALGPKGSLSRPAGGRARARFVSACRDASGGRAREAVGAVLPFLSLCLSLILARPVNYSLQLNKVTEVPPLPPLSPSAAA